MLVEGLAALEHEGHTGPTVVVDIKGGCGVGRGLGALGDGLVVEVAGLLAVGGLGVLAQEDVFFGDGRDEAEDFDLRVFFEDVREGENKNEKRALGLSESYVCWIECRVCCSYFGLVTPCPTFVFTFSSRTSSAPRETGDSIAIKVKICKRSNCEVFSNISEILIE